MSGSESAGGGERYYFNLLRKLKSQQVNARGLVVGAQSDCANISSFASPDASLVKRWLSLRKSLRGTLSTCDLVAAHFAPYVFPILDSLRSQPLLIHFHGPWALESAVEGANKFTVAAKHMLERVVYSQATRFIVLSKAFGEILAARYGVNSDKIVVVPGGVDIVRFNPSGSRLDARARIGWPNDRPIILTVRRLVTAKGVENLIDSIVEVKQRIPDILLVIVGSGPLAQTLANRVKSLNLDSSVIFTGFVSDDDLPDLYRAADLFVVPTIALEGFGLVVLEALACGTAVLVTPVAGLPEVVHALEPSLVLEGSRSQDIADGIIQAFSHSLPLPDRQACAGYAAAFSWDRIAERVARVYREVVESKSA